MIRASMDRRSDSLLCRRRSIICNPLGRLGLFAAVNLDAAFFGPPVSPHRSVAGDVGLWSCIGRISLRLRETDKALMLALEDSQQIVDYVGIELVVVDQHNVRRLVAENLLVQLGKVVDLSLGEGQIIFAQANRRCLVMP